MKLIKRIIPWIKKYVDKIYYSEYTLSRETLIREMFPWINNIWEYKKINDFLLTHDISELNDIIWIIYSFYWGQVSILVHNNKESEVIHYKWLLELVFNLERFRDVYISENESI